MHSGKMPREEELLKYLMESNERGENKDIGYDVVNDIDYEDEGITYVQMALLIAVFAVLFGFGFDLANR
ncbi:hypothetical protein PRIPAC_97184 [Pristionchus pacificus]|uniref:Uncharacterized protein n=1 Tax=Pristionchus pacificus TaxID=54126 RepID=A0A2A6CUF0_PRIPA|nr:hypothetical protein PRIPAC_97184 [Pristionchus pacificus]|eukprot:PDM81779.1 hypothetical protein PRIPAC_37621 [Pristionchus pacificus]